MGATSTQPLRVLACRLAIAFLLPLAAHGATPQLAQPVQFWRWANERAATVPALQSLLSGLDGSYEVIFIPGILGSKLTIDGKYVYGEQPIDAAKLAYRPGQSVTAAPLESFRTQLLGVNFGSADIYGQGLDGLAVAVSTGRPVHVFAYDWRQDIDRSADQFRDWLNRHHAKKRLVIVAHSMGGLVAWRWKQKHYAADAGPRLVGMMLAGSPLQGTCEAVRMIVGGYGAPEGSPLWERAAISMVFEGSHAAVLTFPSVYQLLPRYGSDLSPCLKVFQSGTQFPKDHHDPLAWIKRHGTDDIDASAAYRLRNFAALAGMDARTYARLVLSAVAAGKRFRKEFAAEHDGGNLALLYSEARPLAPFHVVRLEDDWPTAHKSAATNAGVQPGDGRVLADSAKNGVNREANLLALSIGTRFARLQKEHGDLINDPQLHVFVRDELPLWLQRDKMLEVWDFVLRDPQLAKEVAERGWVVRPSTFAFANDSKTAARAQLVSQHNLQVALGNATDKQAAALGYVSNVLKVDGWSAPTPNDEVAIALLESAVIARPRTPSPDSLVLMGQLLAKQGRHPEAIVALESSSYWHEKGEGWLASTNRSTKIYSALARSYEKIGDMRSAEVAAAVSDPLIRDRNWAQNPSDKKFKFVWEPMKKEQMEKLIGRREDHRI